ncbi:glycosyltransferase family 39 protein [Candidatus Pacearchaeota archaeon]|nr:glycosyltransferase family 39 protein [Candidatus Pacearchaeota archaeon]
MVDQEIENRKKAVTTWLQNPWHLALIAIILIAAGIRIYYFTFTEGQTYWWDEAEYMATAKHWVFDVPYDVNEQRPPLFQLLASLFLLGGFSERFILFLLVVLPSIGIIIASYFFGKTLFDRRVGVFVAFGMTFTWSYLFWSTRFQPDFFSLLFQIIGITFFWKTITTKQNKYGLLTGFFIALAFYFKISTLVVPLGFALFLFITEQKKTFTTPAYYAIGISFIVTLIPFFIWQYVAFGNPIAFAPSYADSAQQAERDWGWQALTYIYSFAQPDASFLKGPFAILALLGCFIFLGPFLLTCDKYFLSSERIPRPELLILSLIVCTELFYIFWTQGTIEDRWILIIAPLLFVFSALGVLFLYKVLTKKSALFAFLIIALLLGAYGYAHLTHMHALTTIKKDSYAPVKDISLYLKEILAPTESWMTVSYTQGTTYSERKVITYGPIKNSTAMNELVEREHPRYLVDSIFEPRPAWLDSWIAEQGTKLSIIKVIFADQTQKQPLLILYKFE